MISILYDCFKYWSKAGSVYIYSDTHFSDAEHFKLLKANNHVPEGINTVEELDELQIKNINAVCHKCDTLILLGDVGNVELVKRLKAGCKVLITGNHDHGKEYYKPYFSENMVFAGFLAISDKIILSHEEFRPCPTYVVNLHGHTHDRPFKYTADGITYYNFCAEAINYQPVSLSELIKHGLLSGVDDIHRVAVDRAIDRKSKREKKTV